MTSRTHFHESLDHLRADVGMLGAMVQDAVRDALAALVGDDRQTARDVIAGDDGIDALFLALEERAYALVAQQAPVAADLRFLMSALRVMSDYEKAGDRAVAVAKAALANWEREATTLSLLGRMGELAHGLLADAGRAWTDQDLVAASELERRDDILDGCYRRLVEHLLAQRGPAAPGLVLHAHAAGRNLERIADHAVIVGERVGYMLTGDTGSLAAEVR